MIRYERRKGIKALAYKSFANIKNNIFETLKKPYRLVALAVKTVLPFILFPIMKLATKQEFPIHAEWVFVIIPLALFSVNCYWAFKRVRDTQFTLADVNLLFTSPMPKSLIYMWSMGKSVLFTLFTIGALALAPVIPSLLRTIGLVLAFSALGTQILRCTIYSKDFFEDAANTAVRGKRIKDAVSRRDIDALSTERPTLAVGGSKNVSVNGHYREATAFLWKFILTNKRNARSLFAKTLKTSIFLLASIALGFFARGKLLQELVFPAFVLGNILQATGNSLLSGVEYELRKSYVFLLPGSFRKKLFALNLIPMTKTLVMNTVITMSLFFLSHLSAAHCFILWFALTSMTITNLYSVVIFKCVFANREDKNILLKLVEGFNELVVQFPTFGITFLSYHVFSQITVSLLVFAACNMLILGFTLYFSETAFARLEMIR